MKKYFFDTNFIFGLFNEVDSLHEFAEEVFASLDDDSEFITSTAVIAELLCAGDEIDFISRLEILKFTVLDVDYKTIIKLDELIPPEKRRKIKAIDSIILAQTIFHNAELLSFDEKLIGVFERL